MRVIVIGSGIGGLGTACLLAKAGHEVTVFERNDQVGGRAGQLEAKGFRFDTGPSWYLMPDVFENFFEALGEKIEDHLTLTRLSPGCRVTFKGHGQQVDILGDLKRDKATFEAIEPGAGKQLERYLDKSEYIYRVAMERFLYRNYDGLRTFISPGLLREARSLSLLSDMDRYAGRYFTDPRLRKLIQFPLVFLGTDPSKAPALYSLMGHVVFNQGVFYPKGGLYEVTKALERIAREAGVTFKLNAPVRKIMVKDGHAAGVRADGMTHTADAVVSNAGIHHTETDLLDPPYRDHSESYWRRRTLAPSALLMYLGVDRQYDSLLHHNLIFSQDWRKNFKQLFKERIFPDDPSFYVCAPGKTDAAAAPEGCENLFVLVPLAAGLEYTAKGLDRYAEKILATMETELNLPDLRKHIVYKKLFSVKDFAGRFNSFRGTGLGLAHTVRQTAAFRPANRSKKLKGLYYAGADVHPGIGVPASLISAQLAAGRPGLGPT